MFVAVGQDVRGGGDRVDEEEGRESKPGPELTATIIEVASSPPPTTPPPLDENERVRGNCKERMAEDLLNEHNAHNNRTRPAPASTGEACPAKGQEERTAAAGAQKEGADVTAAAAAGRGPDADRSALPQRRFCKDSDLDDRVAIRRLPPTEVLVTVFEEEQEDETESTFCHSMSESFTSTVSTPDTVVCPSSASCVLPNGTPRKTMHIQQPARANLLDVMLASSGSSGNSSGSSTGGGSGSSSSSESGEEPADYQHLHRLHRFRRQKKASATREQLGVLRYPATAPRPSIIGRDDFYVRYGDKEREAVASFDFLEDLSTTSVSGASSCDTLGSHNRPPATPVSAPNSTNASAGTTPSSPEDCNSRNSGLVHGLGSATGSPRNCFTNDFESGHLSYNRC